MIKKILWVFFISILPIIELRGAVPVGAALDIPFYYNFIAALLGNMLPVPFILLFIPRILDWLERFRLFRPIVKWVKRKAYKHKSKVVIEQNAQADDEGEGAKREQRRGIAKLFGLYTGLFLFVALPLPGTGAWTGSLIASLFNLPKKQSFLAVLAGVAVCGVIMCLASYGVVGFLSFLAK